MESNEVSIRVLVEEIVRREHPKTVGELFKLALRERSGMNQDSFVRVVEGLRREGKITLESPFPRFEGFTQYIISGSMNLWFYLVLLATLGTVAAVYLLPDLYPVTIVRWVIGGVFVLYLPGYAVIEALFPSRKSLDGVARFALSVVLSLAIVMLTGLFLNYTPWGIRLDPIVVSLSTFTVVAALTGTYRKYLLLGERERPTAREA